MTTKLTEPLRREIEIDGQVYTIVLSQRGVRISKKRFRSGKLVTWRSLVVDQPDREHHVTKRG